MSACCLTANRNPNAEAMAAAEAIKTREQAEEAARAPGFGPSVNLASAAAWSPNPKNPPLYLDLPVKDGKVRPDIVAKWVANAPLEMLEQHAAALKSYYAVAIDIGTKDGLLASNQQLHEAMTRLRIPHDYEEYDGDHTNKVRERIETRVLPFFSKNLAAPANPTSPRPGNGGTSDALSRGRVRGGVRRAHHLEGACDEHQTCVVGRDCGARLPGFIARCGSTSRASA